MNPHRRHPTVDNYFAPLLGAVSGAEEFNEIGNLFDSADDLDAGSGQWQAIDSVIKNETNGN